MSTYEQQYMELAQKVEKTATEGTLEEAKEAMTLYVNNVFNQESCNLLIKELEEANSISTHLLKVGV